MTAFQVYILQCNACDAVTDYAPGRTRQLAQREARELGWYCTRRTDYCPQHRPPPAPAHIHITHPDGRLKTLEELQAESRNR